VKNRIGIMAAMHEELNRIVTMLENITQESIGHKQVYLGTLNNQNVVVVFSGWGKVAAASTTTMLIERFAISQLIFTGVAGAMQKHLAIGDIIIGSSFMQHDMDCAGVLGIKRFEIPLLGLTEIPSDVDLQAKANKAANTYLSDKLKADVIKMEDSIVSSASYADGNGGNIKIVTNRLQMQGASFIDTSTYGGLGNAGNIIVNSQTLIMKDDASITTVAHQDSTGNAGNITIAAKDISITGSGNGAEKSALISSNTTSNSKGQGGEINITTDTLSLYQDATIGVTSKGTGNAGNIYIGVGLKFSAENGYVLSQGQTANGGNIDITAGNQIDLQQSQIKTNAVGKGGNISLKTALFILDQSQINASSTDRTGGNIDLEIDTYIRSKELGSVINATGVIDGLITISSPEIDLGKVLKNLNVDLLTNSVKDPCSIQVVSDESYLAINKKGCK